MTWSQVMWKIQNRKTGAKKRKTDAKNRNGRNLKKCLNWLYISEFPGFFSTPRHFLRKRPFAFFLRICCAFFADFLRFFFASRCGGAMCQGMPMHDRALPKEPKTQRFSISVPALMICTVVPGRVQRFEILHTCAGLEAVQYQAQVVHATRDREPFLHGLTMPICC